VDSTLPVSLLTRDILEERVHAQIRDALMEGRFAAGCAKAEIGPGRDRP